MLKVKKTKIEIDSKTKKRVEFYLDRTSKKYKFICGNLVKLNTTNLTYVEPHKAIFEDFYLPIIKNKINNPNEVYKRNIEEEKNKLDRAREAYLLGTFDLDTYRKEADQINNAKCEIEKEIDTHGGFNGDGDYFARLKCSNISYDKLSSNWKVLPLSDELDSIMKMEQCDSDSCKDVYEKYSIPNITNGYYYFLDCHSESNNKYDDPDLNNRSSWNFTLAIFDMDTNIIYYYKLDT